MKNFGKVIDVLKNSVVVMLFAIVSADIHMQFSDNLEANAFLFGLSIAIGILCLSLKNKYLRFFPTLIVSVYVFYTFVDNILMIF